MELSEHVVETLQSLATHIPDLKRNLQFRMAIMLADVLGVKRFQHHGAPEKVYMHIIILLLFLFIFPCSHPMRVLCVYGSMARSCQAQSRLRSPRFLVGGIIYMSSS